MDTNTYSIDNGTTFSNNPVFSNLSPGSYDAVLQYSVTEQWYCDCVDPAQTLVIGSPAAAVIASGGVSQLAGCTLSNQGGTIRFSNVSGGTQAIPIVFDGGTFRLLMKRCVARNLHFGG
jgi:hypothetical protein